VVYLFALAAGLCTVGLLVAAGGAGYAIAHAPGSRGPILGVIAGSVLVAGAGGAILGSVAYTRLFTVAVVTVSSGPTPGPTSTAGSQTPAGTGDFFRPATDAWMHFSSDTGDYVAGGVLKVWTIKESTFAIGGTNSYLRMSVSGEGDWWYLDFRAPSNGHLVPGQFQAAERAPFTTGKAPGLQVTGDGRGCNTVSGRFEIKTIDWTSAATVAEIDIVFEQHCEGMSPALRGELWMTTEIGVHKTPPAASSAIAF